MTKQAGRKTMAKKMHKRGLRTVEVHRRPVPDVRARMERRARARQQPGLETPLAAERDLVVWDGRRACRRGRGCRTRSWQGRTGRRTVIEAGLVRVQTSSAPQSNSVKAALPTDGLEPGRKRKEGRKMGGGRTERASVAGVTMRQGYETGKCMEARGGGN